MESSPFLPPQESSRVSVAEIIQQAIEPILRKHPADIRLDVDLAGNLPEIDQPEPLSILVRHLVRDALELMPEGGELSILGCRAPGGWDLEIADTGPPADNRPQIRQWAAAKLQGETSWHNCPQGGCAVVVRFRDRQRLVKVA
jgi:signal transduction histidine kinase